MASDDHSQEPHTLNIKHPHNTHYAPHSERIRLRGSLECETASLQVYWVTTKADLMLRKTIKKQNVIFT